jgi:phosphonate transport system ATP-binding protein
VSVSFHGVDLTLSGTAVLRGIDLALKQGEQAALIGPSGAGKTSLLMTANTLLRPSGGRLELLGEAPWAQGTRALRRLRARIGCVYQSPPFPPRQRVINAVAAGRLGRMGTAEMLWSLISTRDAAGVEQALERVDLPDKLWERCDTLSGGQRQRVGLARVLYQQPRLILADEPVASLDPHLAETSVRMLCAEARERQATLLMSLHSVELALAHFPRLIGLRDGKVLFDLPRAEVNQALLERLYAGEQSPPASGVGEPPLSTRKGGLC